MSETKIEWTDRTWNPVAGCRRISPGCDHCYAIPNAHRLAGNDNTKISNAYLGTTQRVPGVGTDWTGKINLLPERLELPLSWKTPARIFVNSMSDLFHDDVSEEFVYQVFTVMVNTPQHIYQILTKRPDRMRRLVVNFCESFLKLGFTWPLLNVWLGVSYESQDYAWRIEKLTMVPAAVRFISAEPLLGPLDLRQFMQCGYYCDESVGHVDERMPGINWVIVGGESGRDARECKVEWMQNLVAQCQETHVPVFVKQLGTYWARRHGSYDPKAGIMSEWPEALQVREYPHSEVSVDG